MKDSLISLETNLGSILDVSITLHPLVSPANQAFPSSEVSTRSPNLQLGFGGDVYSKSDMDKAAITEATNAAIRGQRQGIGA